MSKKVKESQRSVSTAVSTKVKEAIKPSNRVKYMYDTRTGWVTRIDEQL